MLAMNLSALTAELESLSRIAGKSSTIPILSHVTLSADGGRLAMAATDLDLSLTTSVEASGFLAPVCAPCKRLLDAARSMSGDEATLEADGTSLRLSAGGSRVSVRTLSADDFPLIPSRVDGEVAIAGGVLAKLIGRTSHAMAVKGATRFQLVAGRLTVAGGQITMECAVDSRFAVAKLAQPSGDALTCLVAADALAELRQIDSPSSPVYFGVLENHLTFRIGERTLVVRKMEGQFPDVSRVLAAMQLYDEARPVGSATLSRLGLIAAIRCVQTVHLSNQRGMTLTAGRDSVELSVATDAGQAASAVPAEVDGEIVIGMGADYLRQALESTPGELVRIQFSRPDAPLMVSPWPVVAGEEQVNVIAPFVGGKNG